MSNPHDTFVPIERESEIKCNYLDCAAGTGLAGNGHCFLGGNPYIKDCPEFISDEEFEKNQQTPQ